MNDFKKKMNFKQDNIRSWTTLKFEIIFKLLFKWKIVDKA